MGWILGDLNSDTVAPINQAVASPFYEVRDLESITFLQELWFGISPSFFFGTIFQMPKVVDYLACFC
jgi:hypothetical protein